MKFNCKISVVSVDISRTSHSSPKPCHSTVGLGHGSENRSTSADSKSTPLYMKVCSDKNKQGTRYKVTSNIRAMFHRFAASQGRATVSLHHPKVDIHISEANPVELCHFLTVLRMPPEKQMNFEDITSLSDMSVAKKAIKKFVTSSMADYRTALSKLPSTLEVVEVTSVGLVEIDIRVMRLASLRFINVSTNALTSLPVDVAWPENLSQLDLSHNQLTDIPLQFSRSTLAKSLVNLNVSHNPISSLPYSLCQFKALLVLDVNHCTITRLPHTIGDLKQLRRLDVSFNKLRYLPKSLASLRLEELSMAGIQFDPLMLSRRGWPPAKTWAAPSLMDLAATVIVRNRIRIEESQLPWIVNAYLRSALSCECGCPIFLNGLSCLTLHEFRGVAASLQYNADRRGEPMETGACSRRCFERFRHKLYPLPDV